MTRALDVLLRFDRAGPPLRAQLEDQLRDAVRGGRLGPGAALPSSRALARELGVSRGVVVEAYAQLAAEGYLVARQGAPTRVSEAASPGPGAAPSPAGERPPRFDCRTGRPDVSLFPRDAWLASLRRALRDAPDARLDYGDPRGAPELRAALARYLGRVRGVACDPERVVVTSGMAQGMALFARALTAGGARRIAMEDPSSAPGRGQLAANGLEIVPIPVDEDGLQTARLPGAAAGERAAAPGERGPAASERGAVASERRAASQGARIEPVDAVMTTPAHQFPLGVVLAPRRRAALLDWAAATGAVVLEDDYDAEYRYDRQPVGAVQGLAPERVVYAGSTSKTLAPGLRLGWLVVPEGLLEPITAAKESDDLGTPVVEQLALADFLERGRLDRHLRRTRAVYRARRDALVAALERRLPQCEPTGVAAGLHLVVRLPAGTDERQTLEAARSRGLGLAGISEHRIEPGPPALLLGYGRLPEPSIEPAVEALADSLRA
ncbi:MAG TPA: PLP-dependent aminotransferase family protein [Thermoleophilaceae bacterium]|nr:PLP-dependent aminotransferase family protein [Thermoleophilaceae bacterium]